MNNSSLIHGNDNRLLCSFNQLNFLAHSDLIVAASTATSTPQCSSEFINKSRALEKNYQNIYSRWKSGTFLIKRSADLHENWPFLRALEEEKRIFNLWRISKEIKANLRMKKSWLRLADIPRDLKKTSIHINLIGVHMAPVELRSWWEAESLLMSADNQIVS